MTAVYAQLERLKEQAEQVVPPNLLAQPRPATTAPPPLPPPAEPLEKVVPAAAQSPDIQAQPPPAPAPSNPSLVQKYGTYALAGGVVVSLAAVATLAARHWFATTMEAPQPQSQPRRVQPRIDETADNGAEDAYDDDDDDDDNDDEAKSRSRTKTKTKSRPVSKKNHPPFRAHKKKSRPETGVEAGTVGWPGIVCSLAVAGGCGLGLWYLHSASPAKSPEVPAEDASADALRRRDRYSNRDRDRDRDRHREKRSRR